MRLKFKIVIMVMIASLLPVIAQYFLSRYAVYEVDHAVLDQMKETSRNNLKNMALNVYDMCKIADSLIQEQLKNDVVAMDRILTDAGGVRISPQEQVEWKAKNQLTGKEETVRLPKMCVGSEWFGQNFSFSTPVPSIDLIREFTGEDCTILQRMNEQGDMLRIATTVKTSDGSRATATYVPAVDRNGNPNQMIATILSGKKYVGRMQVVDTTYITSYNPIKDQDGKVIGCTFLGVKLSAMESIKKVLSGIKVGRSGYVGVMIGTGENKGTYVISQGGKNDGVNIFEKTDADGRHFIKDMISDAIQKKARWVSRVICGRTRMIRLPG